VVLVIAALVSSGASAAPAGCLGCHRDELPTTANPHGFLGARCEVCHGGDTQGATQQTAHAGLIPFPGLLDNASRTCGGCHAAQVRSVTSSLMHSGKGMVTVTRSAFGDQQSPDGDAHLSRLGHTPADSLLRKLCASCHLGQPKEQHALDPVGDRGGGCLACHVNGYPNPGHPALSARVEDARCFGCHSRSGRVALSYAGLAEIDPEALDRPETRSPGRLPDGRLVERRAADLHHQAGMACIDCHTGPGLMGPSGGQLSPASSVDIQCSDCHANRQPRTKLSGGAARPGAISLRLPFPAEGDQPFLVTARLRTPLWHIKVGKEGNLLYPKLGGPALRIPDYTEASHAPAREHRNLSCQACHSRWAPQCYGCHLAYSEQGEQWDHAARAATPGVWRETRSLVRNGPPTLGVGAEGRIYPHVPGMVFTAAHPDMPQPFFRRLFAPLDPHTTGPSRGCRGCHADPMALGLGEGELTKLGRVWTHAPIQPTAADGLPADAWTSIDGKVTGDATRAGHRPFDAEELRRILDALYPPPVNGEEAP
jgi:hypothetical protein